MAEKLVFPTETSKSLATLVKERGLVAVNPSEHALYRQLTQTLPRVSVGKGRPTYYVAEGDLLLDDDELYFYALQREHEEKQSQERKALALVGMLSQELPDAEESGLVGMLHQGRFVRWDDGVRLTYCVLRSSFKRAEDHELVVKNMAAATVEWSAICNVRFKHVQQLDASIEDRPAGALFVVREWDTGGRLIAMAFFPTDPVERREVIIDPVYYKPKAEMRFDKVGVLRHELGHVLGFRHEHILSEAPPDCPKESTKDTFNYTLYDPRSVMHYFCGGVGSEKLAFSTLDILGAQQLYGPPAAAARPGGLGAFEPAASEGGLDPAALFPRPKRLTVVRA